MATMGNTMEQSVALMVGAGEQMPHQSGKIARGLRSIALELNKYAQENKYLKTSLGDISLYDKQTGALKSTFNVLSDLYKIYPKLSKEEQTQIGLKLAGKNQYEVFSATMNGFSNVLKANETALNSQGSAMNENDKYMESLSA